MEKTFDKVFKLALSGDEHIRCFRTIISCGIEYQAKDLRGSGGK